MTETKILIVEDELLIAKGLARQLTKIGYRVDKIVSSSKTAIDYINSNSFPDVILMDIAIKGQLNGIETAIEIRKKHDIPIIYLTAYTDDKTIEKAVDTGGYGYILKPYKVSELKATIKMALKKHQEKNEIQNSLTEVAELLGQYSSEKKSIYEDSLTNMANQLMLRDIFSYLLTKVDSLATAPKINQVKNVSIHSKLEKQLIAFIYIKLDRFQRFPDYFGNDKSDLLIKLVAHRLTECTSNFEGDAVPLRLQYSEFGILLGSIRQRQVASKFAQLLLDAIQQPFQIDETKIFLTASMGISFYPFDNLKIDRLLEQAKQAMLYAQEQGGNKYNLYTSAFNIMTKSISNDLVLETDLHEALKSDELELYYQPKIDLKTGTIVSSEALIRWNHPRFGLILPDKIISLAVENNLIEPLGEWVLKTACSQNKTWHKVGFDYLRIAINLSGKQLNQPDLFHKLTQLLFDLNLDPNFLELELTEQILVDNIKQLNQLKSLGVYLSLDDFGTGYSSLGYLNQFNFDILKIDRCFVKEIDRNPTNAVIAKATIKMAHQLNLRVVAEGVETEAELDFFVRHQCDEVQGYLFSRPLPTREFENLLLSKQQFLLSPPTLT